VRKVMLLLERNLSRPLPTEYLARHAGLSVRQLQRLFKLELGMGPTEFALKLRLAHAHQQVSPARPHSWRWRASAALPTHHTSRAAFAPPTAKARALCASAEPPARFQPAFKGDLRTH